MMLNKIVGDLSESAITTKRYVWKIPEFSSLRRLSTDDFYHASPTFTFMNASFHFRMFPPDGYFDMYVSLVYESGSICDVYYSIGLQKSDGTLFGTKTYHDTISKYYFDYDCATFKASDLRSQRLALFPSDTLTLICDLKCDFKHTLSLEEAENNGKEKIALEPREHTSLAGETSLCQDYKRMFLDGQNHDLILRVEDKEFPVHRDILRARSRVFESMLSHDMKEKNSGVIDVPDCDPEAMKEFLLYVYCGQVETLDEDNAIGLYYVADKYDMKTLKEECCEFMKKSVSPTNVCKVIQLALNHSDSGLLECATKYFCVNSHNVLPTVEWQSFLKDNSTVANELLIKAIDTLRNTKI